MTAPISTELFQELFEVYKKIPDADGPFVPFVGKSYGAEGYPRIMFVGKATAGWDCDEIPTIDRQISLARQFIEGKLVSAQVSGTPYWCRSAYWRFVLRITANLTNQTDDKKQILQIFEHMAWSNLMKIGVRGRFPTGRNATLQRNLAKRLLLHEIEVLTPDCIIGVSNEYEHELVDSVFGCRWVPLGAENLKTRKAIMHPGETAVYFTVHPQGKKQSIVDTIRQAIVRDFAKHRS